MAVGCPGTMSRYRCTSASRALFDLRPFAAVGRKSALIATMSRPRKENARIRYSSVFEVAPDVVVATRLLIVALLGTAAKCTDRLATTLVEPTRSLTVSTWVLLASDDGTRAVTNNC